MRGFLFVLILLLVASCSDSEMQEGTVFNYNESNGISSLDPAFARNLEIMWACNQLFDGLVDLDSSLTIQASLAKSWDISPDGKTYTFHLRNDAYFHESEVFESKSSAKIVAQDFVYSFSRILDDKLASPGRWVFNQVDFDTNGGFSAPNDSTFVIQLKQAFPPFLGLLTTQYCNVIPEEAVVKYGEDFRSKPVGSGPFQFAFWLEEVALVFHKNPNYWRKDAQGTQLPYLDAVKIDFVRDMGAEFQGLLKGEYDFMSGIHASYKDELLSMTGDLRDNFDDIKFQKTAFIKTDYLGILVDEDPELGGLAMLRDQRVRQAINYAIDRDKMVRYLRNNTVYPADKGFIPRGMPPFDDSAGYGYSYDPDRALALLEEAGYPSGKGMETIEISTTGDYVDLMEFIQHELSQIGIPVSINVLQSGPHREMVAKSRLPVFRKSWFADYADAENFLALFYSENFCPSGPNYTHYKSARFDSLFVKAGHELNDGIRLKLYREMDSLVMEQSPIIPLYYDQVSHFVRKEITGLQTNPVNMIDLSTVKKAQ